MHSQSFAAFIVELYCCVAVREVVLWSCSILTRPRLQIVKMVAPAPALALESHNFFSCKKGPRFYRKARRRDRLIYYTIVQNFVYFFSFSTGQNWSWNRLFFTAPAPAKKGSTRMKGRGDSWLVCSHWILPACVAQLTALYQADRQGTVSGQISCSPVIR